MRAINTIKGRMLPLLMIAGLSLFLLSFKDSFFAISKNLEIATALFKEINTTYVEDTDPSKLMRSYLDGMLKTLDPFTNYISESQIETYRIENSEKLTGFGVHFEMHEKVPVITEIIKDLPADKSGLQVGDKILEIDSRSMDGRSNEEVSAAMRGQVGTAISLKVKNQLGETKTVNILRQEFQETNVPFYGMISENIGLINLKIFNQNAGKDVKSAYDSLKRAHPDLKGVVLDLRGNPGGLLTEAVNIVNVFVDKNKLVVTTKGKVAEWNATFKTLNEPSDLQVPLAILTDSKSASASEIVSGCFQDYDRGVVIGQRTYGKGLVQITKNLPYNTMLKVTTAKYYIPTGRCIQALNYAEKNEDGSVKRIPDSLKKEFKTTNGRKVWDGGGVDPDIQLPKNEHSTIAQALQKNHLIFDFASWYKTKHEQIEKPSKFNITDEDYNSFLEFVKTRKFNYQSDEEKVLDKLIQTAKDEKYEQSISKETDALKSKIETQKTAELLIHKSEIKSLLENEICGRYYYIHGKIEKSLQNDDMAKKAMQVLLSPSEYKGILSVKK